MPAVPGATSAPVPEGKASSEGASSTSAARRTAADGACGIAAAMRGAAVASSSRAVSGGQARTRCSALSSSPREVRTCHTASPSVSSRVRPTTSTPVRRIPPAARSCACRVCGSAAMVGDRECTRVPALPAERPRIRRTAAVREPCSARPVLSAGDAAENSRVAGSEEWTPPITGATRRSSTFRPERRRTTCATVAALSSAVAVRMSASPSRWAVSPTGTTATVSTPGMPCSPRMLRVSSSPSFMPGTMTSCVCIFMPCSPSLRILSISFTVAGFATSLFRTSSEYACTDM